MEELRKVDWKFKVEYIMFWRFNELFVWPFNGNFRKNIEYFLDLGAVMVVIVW